MYHRPYLISDSGRFGHGYPWGRLTYSPQPHGEVERITVQVLNWNGTPARDVRVKWPHGLLETDDRGQLSVTRVRKGTYEFELVEPDMIKSRVLVDTRFGGAQNHVLQEPKGGKLEIRVVDSEGRGLPFARVVVQAEQERAIPIFWENLERRIQRVDPFTDREGSRRYEHVAPGTVQIVATWADRWGETRATVTKGKTTLVEIAPLPVR